LLFDRLLHAREARPEHLHIMIGRCRTSREMWPLIKKAALGELRLDVATCTILARKLQEEGDQEGFAAIISTMHTQGLEPDEVMERSLNRGQEELCRLRTAELRNLLDSASPSSRTPNMDAAKELFFTFVTNGVADIVQIHVMLQYCDLSEQMWAIVELVEQRGLQLDGPALH
jgi:hypothetical protein